MKKAQKYRFVRASVTLDIQGGMAIGEGYWPQEAPWLEHDGLIHEIAHSVAYAVATYCKGALPTSWVCDLDFVERSGEDGMLLKAWFDRHSVRSPRQIRWITRVSKGQEGTGHGR